MDGKVKRLRKTKEGYKFEIIEDVATFTEPEVSTDTTETKTKSIQPESGLFTRPTRAKTTKNIKRDSAGFYIDPDDYRYIGG